MKENKVDGAGWILVIRLVLFCVKCVGYNICNPHNTIHTLEGKKSQIKNTNNYIKRCKIELNNYKSD